MRFSDLYCAVLSHWPEEVDISDGEQCGDSGYLFRTLTATWDAIEDKLGHENPWLQLMGWTTSQVFHKEARSLLRKSEAVLRTRQVSASKVEETFAHNLDSAEWRDLRTSYVNDLDP